MHIPMSSPDLTDKDRQAVLAVLNTPYLSMGHFIQDFEKAFCDLTGSKYAIAVSSGTTGLHLCVRAANISTGDLVITTPFSFVASSNVLLYENAVPVFVDVDPRTGNIDPALVRQAVKDLKFGGKVSQKWLPRKGVSKNACLKAILPVNVFGQPARLDDINEIAKEYDLKVIEDSCESLGAEYKGKMAGTFGNYGVFAFYPNKQITTGEGGVIITNDEKAANYMRALRNQGRSIGDTWLQHTYLGYNYRLDEMSAALGVIQMSRFNELMKKRDQVAAWYGVRLGEVQGIEIPVVEPSTTRMSWFVYVIRLDPMINRNMLVKQLAACGIPARPYFTSIHLQPYMIERFGYQEGDFSVTEDLSRRGIALPFSGVMSEEQVEYVCKNIYKHLSTKEIKNSSFRHHQ